MRVPLRSASETAKPACDGPVVVVRGPETRTPPEAKEKEKIRKTRD
jgi:hypothetical protein